MFTFLIKILKAQNILLRLHQKRSSACLIVWRLSRRYSNSSNDKAVYSCLAALMFSFFIKLPSVTTAHSRRTPVAANSSSSGPDDSALLMKMAHFRCSTVVASVLDRIKIGSEICSSMCFIQQHICADVLVLKGRGYKVKGQVWLTNGTLFFSRELADCKITLIFNFFACERNKMSECSRD